MTATCEVLVVGGGPAGAACAGRLRRHGLDVLVLDRSRFPRDKVCAGWITPQVVQALGLDLEEYAAGRVLQPFSGFRTGTIGGRALETRYPQVVSYGIRRCEFDHCLLHRSGARLRLGEPVAELVRDGAGWLVNGAIRAALLVGAGGHACPVARHLGAELHGRIPAVVAREAEIPLDDPPACPVRGDTPELYFCRDLAGYGWAVRKGDWLNVGLGREDGRDLPGHLRAFCGWLEAGGRIPPIPPGRFKGHAYLLYGHAPRRTVADGALLVGDAAGLAYPQSGEGIRPAVESGLLAADLIAGLDGDYREARLAEYAIRLRRRLGAPPPYAAPGRRAALGRLLLGSRRFTRQVVLDRWFLHREVAALAS